MWVILSIVVAALLWSGCAFGYRGWKPLRRLPSGTQFFLAYTLLSLLCFASLIVCGSVVPGGLTAAGLAAVSLVRAYRERRLLSSESVDRTSLLVRAVFTLLVATIFGPYLVGEVAKYAPPDIYDFPKHIGAVVSVANAAEYPTPNPYAPDAPFAYNVFFYLPLGLIVRLSQSARMPCPVMAWGTLMVCWHMLALLEGVAKSFSVPRRHLGFGMLLGTFAVGFNTVILQDGFPVGCTLYHGMTKQWFDDPITAFVYIPQHIFSCACLIASYLCIGRTNARNFFAGSLLIAGGSLSSFILAPIQMAVFGVWTVFTVLKLRNRIRTDRAMQWSIGLGFASTCAIVLPVMLEARRWAGMEGTTIISYEWQAKEVWYTVLSAGIILPLATAMPWVAGLRSLFTFRTACYVTIFAVCAPLCLIKTPATGIDQWLKIELLFRFLMLAPAMTTLALLIERAPHRGSLGALGLRAAVGYCALIGIPLTMGYIAKSYQRNSADLRALISYAGKLPFDQRMALPKSDQFLAGMTGHMVTMDMAGPRPDRYLPADDRLAAAKFFHNEAIRNFSSRDELIVLSKSWPEHVLYDLQLDRAPCEEFGDWLVYEGGGESGSASVEEIEVPIGPNWQVFGASKAEVSTSPLGVKSNDLVDTALITPLHLGPGCYRITIEIAGKIQGDAPDGAHLSLLGVEKLISIPVGDYSNGLTMRKHIVVKSTPLTGHLAFGLGGWCRAKGEVVMKSLKIEELRRTAQTEGAIRR